MAWYGFEHRYGANTRDESGDLIGTLHIFQRRIDRDAWIGRGREYETAPGARTTMKSRDAARWQRISAAVERH